MKPFTVGDCLWARKPIHQPIIRPPQRRRWRRRMNCRRSSHLIVLSLHECVLQSCSSTGDHEEKQVYWKENVERSGKPGRIKATRRALQNACFIHAAAYTADLAHIVSRLLSSRWVPRSIRLLDRCLSAHLTGWEKWVGVCVYVLTDANMIGLGKRVKELFGSVENCSIVGWWVSLTVLENFIFHTTLKRQIFLKILIVAVIFLITFWDKLGCLY